MLPGAGFSLLFFLAGLGMVFSGVLGYLLPPVRRAEEALPDHDATPAAALPSP